MPYRIAICLSLIVLAAGAVRAERMLPPAPKVTGKLVLVDWRPRSVENRTDDLSVRTLQGLVNRENPRIWVGVDHERPGDPGWWLERFNDMKAITTEPDTLTKDEFLQKYKGYAKGIVVPPRNLGRIGYRVAVMKAAADSLIVGTPELAESLGLKVVEDYSTRFKTYADSWRYALDELWPKLSHDVVLLDRDDLAMSTATVDYVVQHKAFLCGPHQDDPREMELFNELLSRLSHNTPVVGSVGGGGLCSEGDIVRAVSKAGKVFVPCSTTPNLSVHGGIGQGWTPEQPMRKPPKLDRSKVYVAVEISDGDNTNVQFFHIPRRDLWKNRGRVPLGWTVGQGAFELGPAVMQYYYSTRSELDEFIAGVSGYAYVFPGDFGNGLSSIRRKIAWNRFLRRTDEFLASSDISAVTTLHYQENPGPVSLDILGGYADLENISCIINGYNAVYNEYGGKTLEMVDGMPVFHTVTDRTWSEPGGKILADDVIERTPKERPAFMALFMLPFPLTPDHFDQVVDSLQRLEKMGYEVVLPSELAALAKEASKGR